MLNIQINEMLWGEKIDSRNLLLLSLEIQCDFYYIVPFVGENKQHDM